MVQLTTVVLAAILAAPSLAAPVMLPGHEHHQHAAGVAHLDRRDPKFRAAARKTITSNRVGAAGSVAAAGATIAATQASARDLEALEELLAREPIFKKAFKAVKKVVTSGRVSAAAEVGSAAATVHASQQAREFDEREPKIGAVLGKARKAVTSGRVGAAAEVGAAAATIHASQQARDLEELEELLAREPIFKKVFKAVKKVVTSGRVGAAAEVGSAAATVHASQQARDLEELEELLARSPIFKKAFKAVKKVVTSGRVSAAAEVGSAAATVHASQQAREFDDLEEREPKIGAALGKARKAVTSGRVGAAAEVGAAAATIHASQQARDLEALEELLAREPIFKKVFKAVKKVVTSGRVGAAAEVGSAAATVHASQQARDVDLLEELEEFAAREPIFGKALKGVKKAVGAVAHAVSQPDIEEVEEVEARDPRIRAALRKVTSGRVGAAAEVAAADATIHASQQARDLEDLEVRFRGGRMGGMGRMRARDLEDDIEGLVMRGYYDAEIDELD